MATLRETSKREWTPVDNSLEAINAGSLQRIADAKQAVRDAEAALKGHRKAAIKAINRQWTREEIAEARWFSRADLFRLCSSGEVKIPPKISIARHLIERWYGAQLPGSWSRP